MKLKNVKIGTQILLGIIVILGLFIAIGFVAYYQTNKIHEQTELIYQHPLQVRRALGILNTSIQKMRVATRDLMLAINDNERDKAVFEMELATIEADNMFKIIKENYLGHQKDVEEAYQAYLIWKMERNINTKLAYLGDLNSIKENIDSKGSVGSLREIMLEKINVIDQFAKNKADVTFKNSKLLNDKLNRQIIIYVSLAISITLFVYLLFILYIRNPLKKLTLNTLAFSDGNYSVRNQYQSENELGELSSAFNGLAEKIMLNTNLNEKASIFASEMVIKDEAREFFKLTIPTLLSYTGSQIGSVYLLNEKKTGYQHYYSVGIEKSNKDFFSIEDLEGEFGFPILTQQINHIKNLAKEDPLAYKTSVKDFKINEILTIPIVISSEIIAIISLATLGEFDPFAIQFIKKIHFPFSARIEGVLAFRKIRKYAEQIQTEKDNLSKLSAYNRCLIESSLDPFVIIGKDGKITDINRATELITGLERDQLVGKDFAIFFTDSQKALMGYKKVFTDGFVKDYELSIKNVNGKVTPVLYNASIFKDENDEIIGIFAAARDISEQKLAQQEMLKLNNELNEKSNVLLRLNYQLESQKKALYEQSTELTEQNRELEVQKEQLNEVNKLKSSFLSNMSHELRTPLNSVIALSGVLSRKLQNQISDEEFSYLDVIQRNGKHLLSLINDILDISRIESGREEILVSTFNLCETINEVAEMIRPQLIDKNIILDLAGGDCNIIMKSDNKKLKHIIQNIIGNAVKFTEEGKITISVKKVNKFVHVLVEDSGIGISKEDLEHIFDEFRQADSGTARKFGGTGLGLAIAKKYAELLGGSIIVESEIDKGSLFTIKLPIEINSGIDSFENFDYIDHTMSNSNEKYSIENNEISILLVDDSDPAIIQMKDFLEESGFNVIVANNGNEALAKISEKIPQGIILDLMMPELDGFELLKLIRDDQITTNIPVLILTAKHITKDEMYFLKSNNIYQLIQKGDINKAEFIKAVSNMVLAQKK
ncbi:MAG: hypothetical protein CVU02_00025 [Bacteroidetes bacterium HGW-Bacteroidetes-19]|nr:MAG: hypothetical protein CVU02_00025 [Bacteroidetes bacterium HGW-Bacteroidetes-19]